MPNLAAWLGFTLARGQPGSEQSRARNPGLSGTSPVWASSPSLCLSPGSWPADLLHEQESLPEGQVSTSVGHTQRPLRGESQSGSLLGAKPGSEVSPAANERGHLVTCGWPFSKL